MASLSSLGRKLAEYEVCPNPSANAPFSTSAPRVAFLLPKAAFFQHTAYTNWQSALIKCLELPKSAACLGTGSQAGRTQLAKSYQEAVQTAALTHNAARDAKSKAQLSAERPSPHP